MRGERKKYHSSCIISLTGSVKELNDNEVMGSFQVQEFKANSQCLRKELKFFIDEKVTMIYLIAELIKLNILNASFRISPSPV